MSIRVWLKYTVLDSLSLLGKKTPKIFNTTITSAARADFFVQYASPLTVLETGSLSSNLNLTSIESPKGV